MMMTPHNGQHRRGTLLRVAVITWLLLISAAVVINHVALLNLADTTASSIPSPQVAALEEQLAEIAQQVELSQMQPVALPQARYESESQAVDQRLAAIEQTLDEHVKVEDLLPLQAHIEQLEARFASVRPATPAVVRPQAPAPSKPPVIEPPFQVIGTELRAGEQFLSILPAGSTVLSQVRLLRPGEAEANWRLDTIEGSTAVFRHGDKTQRMAIPTR